MSWFSNYLRQKKIKQRDARLRRNIGRIHDLRYNLAYYVAERGFEIGDYSYGDPVIRTMWSDSRLIVGKYCSIAEGVQFILGGNHNLDHGTTFALKRMSHTEIVEDGPFSRGDIVIGSDVWICADATILSGVTIGDGAIIGACAVVPRDVPPYAVVVGNPARVTRKRFSDDIIDRLLAARWWDLPDTTVASLQALLQSDNIGGLLAALEKLRGLDPSRVAAAATASPIHDNVVELERNRG